VKLVRGYFICACAWHGQLGAKTPCPACGRPAIDRLDDERIAALRAVEVRPDYPIKPMMRIRLFELGMLKHAGPLPAPSDTRSGRYQRRRHALTDRGRAVVNVAVTLEQQRKRGATA